MQGPIDIAAIKKAHQRFLKRHEALVNESLRVAGRQAEEHVRQRSKFKRRKARSLKDDTKSRIVKTRGGKILRLKWSKPYALYVEYGTRKHIIVPRRAFALRFKPKNSSTFVFAKRVRHPGTRPYKFGWNAASSSHRVLGRLMRQGMTRIAEKF